MKFTWKTTGDRVFDGPDKTDGLMACWNVATLRTLKAALKVDKIDDLDMVEAALSYFVLSVRAEDHTLLPFRMWPDLKLSDFQIAPHPVESFDQDGDCGNCNRPVDAPFHTGVLVPPTSQDPTVIEGEIMGATETP